MMTKKHLKGKETKDGRVCVFWGQTEEDWQKTVFIQSPELARKTAGMKSVTEAARADCPHTTSAEDTWKDGRRFPSDKTAMVVVGGRRADSSRQEEKKITLLPTVQCQKVHREAQGWEGTRQLR